MLSAETNGKNVKHKLALQFSSPSQQHKFEARVTVAV
jgi:hypothetical protein